MGASKAANPIRALIVDDHPIIREGIAALLTRQPDMTVIGTTGRGIEALELIATLRPDILILDVQLPDLSKIEVARHSRDAESPPAILMLSNHEETTYVRTLLKIGARGYLGTSATDEEIVAAVRAVVRGQTAFSAKARAALSTDIDLSAREVDVLRLVAHGRRNKEISAALVISENTVEYHLRNIFQKFQVHSRIDAIQRARELGLVESSPANIGP